MFSLYQLKQIILIIGDLLSFLIALFVGLGIRYARLPTERILASHNALFLFVFLLWLCVNYISGLYDVDKIRINKKFYRLFGEAGGISLILSVIFFYLIPNTDISPKTILVLTIVIGYLISLGWHIFYHTVISEQQLKQSLLFIGLTPETIEIINLIKKERSGYDIRVVIDIEDKADNHTWDGIEVYHTMKTIRPAITNHNISLVIIAPHVRQDADAIRELYELLFWPVQLIDLTSFYENITGRIPPSSFSEGWFLEHLTHSGHPIYDKWCMITDYLIGIIMIVFTGIVYPFIALGTHLTSKGPVIIKQTRTGLNGKSFSLYKFRSMYTVRDDGMANNDAIQFTEKNDKRITSFGKFLRKTHLDELPQSWNLLQRNLTLIGPRPERPKTIEQLEAKMPYYPLRHVVRP